METEKDWKADQKQQQKNITNRKKKPNQLRKQNLNKKQNMIWMWC